MKIYDISGNEIHGKEVVFEYTISPLEINGKTFEVVDARDKPTHYDKVIYLGVYTLSKYDTFLVNTSLEYSRIYLGQLKDK